MGQGSLLFVLCCWVMIAANVCVLCNAAPETHDHLFFSCSFAYQVWGYFLAKCSVYWGVAILAQELKWFSVHCNNHALTNIV